MPLSNWPSSKRLSKSLLQGGKYFITLSLYRSIHRALIRELREKYAHVAFDIETSQMPSPWIQKERFMLEKQLITKYHTLLESRQAGPHFLQRAALARLCAQELHERDGRDYNLLAYSIMSNHLYLVLDIKSSFGEEPLQEYEFKSSILAKFKERTAQGCNRLLGRSGPFWDKEDLSIAIRDRHMLKNIKKYIISHPTKRGLVNHWNDHEFTYLCFD